MQLPPKAVTEYQKLYKQEFGRELTYEKAEAQGMKLLRLFQIIYKPIPKKWLKEVKGGETHHGEANVQETNTA